MRDVEFNDDAQLDTSQVGDFRGSGGGGGGFGGRVALGGGGVGVVGLIIYFVLSQLGGLGGGSAGGLPAGGLSGLSNGQADNASLSQECKTGADANRNTDCAVVAFVNSIQDYWTDQFARTGRTYAKATTNFFRGSVQTGCGGATADTGPFYCPADKHVYIDLTFFDELRTKFHAQGGTFVEGYVIAHEYGHHIQDLLGTNKRVGNDTGPTSGSVRLELQADCYAGVWADHATQTGAANGQPLIKNLTQTDINQALDTASRIGDDYIQTNLGNGRVDQSQFTHGSSAQRQRWFTTGLQTGDPARCSTFDTANL
jgi:hypothetical protein